jgi:hypothetical protein
MVGTIARRTKAAEWGIFGSRTERTESNEEDTRQAVSTKIGAKIANVTTQN